jgi:hypothetical protein
MTQLEEVLQSLKDLSEKYSDKYVVYKTEDETSILWESPTLVIYKLVFDEKEELSKGYVYAFRAGAYKETRGWRLSDISYDSDFISIQQQLGMGIFDIK